MYEISDVFKDIKNGMSIEKIHRKYGGFSIYVPKVQSNYKKRLIEDFNGYNHHLLATKYNISVSTVYTIVREHKKLQNKE